MKLFGNRKGGAYEQPRNGLTETQKKILTIIGIAVLAVAVLTGAAFAAFRMFAKPIEVAKPGDSALHTVSPETRDEKPPVFTPPTVIEKQTVVDEQTGKEETVDVEVPAAHQEGIYNVLVCGTDDDGYRTDTIIIAHLDTNTHDVALLSIPRDTVVESGRGGIMKINAVYAGGGEEGMVRLEGRLKSILGFELDAYVLVGLEAFKQTVDLVGGVDFDVPMNMNYDDPTQDLYIHLNKGMQTLDGEKAMELVRFRKGYASQDIQRTKVQQDFLRALAKKCVSFGSLTKIKDFIDIFKTYVTTDMTAGNMAWFAEQLLKCDFDAMKTYTAEGTGATINGGSYYPLYASSLLKIVNESFNPYDAEITSANIHVITPDAAYGYQRSASSSSSSSVEITVEPIEGEEPEEGEVSTEEGETSEPADPKESESQPAEPPTEEQPAEEQPPAEPTEPPAEAPENEQTTQS